MPILPILTRVMVTAALFGIVAGAVLLLTSSELRVSSRVRQFVSADAPPPVTNVATAQKRKRAELFAQLDARWEKQDRGQLLAKELERANVAMTITEFTLIRLGIAVLLALILIVIVPQFWWAVLIPALLIGFWFPRTYIRGRARPIVSTIHERGNVATHRHFCGFAGVLTRA